MKVYRVIEPDPDMCDIHGGIFATLEGATSSFVPLRPLTRHEEDGQVWWEDGWRYIYEEEVQS